MKSKDDQISSLRKTIGKLVMENDCLTRKIHKLECYAEKWQFLAMNSTENYEHKKMIMEMTKYMDSLTGISKNKNRQAAETIFKNTVN